MFTFELRINGTLIGVVYGHNAETVEDNPPNGETCRYEWRYTDIKTGAQGSGDCVHARPDGLLALAAMILNQAQDMKETVDRIKAANPEPVRKRPRSR